MTADQTEFELRRIDVRRGRDPGIVPISASRLKLHDLCARWYGFEYGVDVDGAVLVDRLPRVRGAAAELGDRYHRVAAALRDGEALEAATEDFAVPLELWERWGKLRAAAARFVDQEPGGHLAATEETISWRFPLPDGRQAEVEARLDELWLYPDDRARVRDYKTGSPWGIPVGRKLRGDPQLRTYALAVHKAYPATWRWEMEILLPESGERRRVRYELDDVEAWEVVLQQNSARLAEDVDFEPRPGPHCRWCPYAVAHCPLGKRLNGPFRPIVDADSAEEWAGFLHYVEAVQKQVKAIVEEWVVAEGAIPLPGGSYGKHTTASLTIPPELAGDAVRVLQQYGITDEDDDDERPFPIRWDGRVGWRYLSGDGAIPELAEMAVRRWRSWFGFKQDRSKRGGRGSDYS